MKALLIFMRTLSVRKGPYEEVSYQSSKQKLRCPLVKPWVTVGFMEA